MQSTEIKPDEIMQKVRNVIENTGDIEYLTQEEIKWLEVHGGVIYIAYKKALEMRESNKEQGGKSNERD